MVTVRRSFCTCGRSHTHMTLPHRSCSTQGGSQGDPLSKPCCVQRSPPAVQECSTPPICGAAALNRTCSQVLSPAKPRTSAEAKSAAAAHLWQILLHLVQPLAPRLHLLARRAAAQRGGAQPLDQGGGRAQQQSSQTAAMHPTHTLHTRDILLPQPGRQQAKPCPKAQHVLSISCPPTCRQSPWLRPAACAPGCCARPAAPRRPAATSL